MIAKLHFPPSRTAFFTSGSPIGLAKQDRPNLFLIIPIYVSIYIYIQICLYRSIQTRVSVWLHIHNTQIGTYIQAAQMQNAAIKKYCLGTLPPVPRWQPEPLQTQSRISRNSFQEFQRLGKEGQVQPGIALATGSSPRGAPVLWPSPGLCISTPNPSHPSGVSRYLRGDPPLSKACCSKPGLQGAPARNSAVRSNPAINSEPTPSQIVEIAHSQARDPKPSSG